MTPEIDKRVAQRDQSRGPLGAHDPGDPGHAEGVALRHAVAAQQLHHVAATPAPCRSRWPTRAVTSLPDTSTMRAAPASSRCVNRSTRRALRPPRRAAAPAPSPADTGDPLGHDDSASACARPAIRCDPAPPTGVTPNAVRVDLGTRTASCILPRSEDRRLREPRAGREAACTARRPVSWCSAGTTNISKETYAETGLPGRREDRRLVLADHAEALRLPGLHRDLDEPDGAQLASASLTTSWAPLLTPPLVTTRSARTSWSLSASRNARGCRARPDPVGDAPAPAPRPRAGSCCRRRSCRGRAASRARAARSRST